MSDVLLVATLLSLRTHDDDDIQLQYDTRHPLVIEKVTCIMIVVYTIKSILPFIVWGLIRYRCQMIYTRYYCLYILAGYGSSNGLGVDGMTIMMQMQVNFEVHGLSYGVINEIVIFVKREDEQSTVYSPFDKDDDRGQIDK
ncbi:uncharacterized protein BX664DRAFT_389711 [Halteromyces radiatus]|uniref:uncharacterized protein n=1 Tax=Halteromyces radiatus TaxID=101107 RepID=UPI002220876E|nr:uncharacterized protein BX664DRAFT_389711 [Halteromyces radiatus]KAI8075975.1 hypothetical protein BX664DRAFT_389711 [Halteromyces radiatus]